MRGSVQLVAHSPVAIRLQPAAPLEGRGSRTPGAASQIRSNVRADGPARRPPLGASSGSKSRHLFEADEHPRERDVPLGQVGVVLQNLGQRSSPFGHFAHVPDGEATAKEDPGAAQDRRVLHGALPPREERLWCLAHASAYFPLTSTVTVRSSNLAWTSRWPPRATTHSRTEVRLGSARCSSLEMVA